MYHTYQCDKFHKKFIYQFNSREVFSRQKCLFCIRSPLLNRIEVVMQVLSIDSSRSGDTRGCLLSFDHLQVLAVVDGSGEVFIAWLLETDMWAS